MNQRNYVIIEQKDARMGKVMHSTFVLRNSYTHAPDVRGAASFTKSGIDLRKGIRLEEKTM